MVDSKEFFQTSFPAIAQIAATCKDLFIEQYFFTCKIYNLSYKQKLLLPISL